MRASGGPGSILVIVNPTAGRMHGRVVERALARLGPTKIVATAGPGDATRVARAAADEGYDCVVASGGDGTIAEVAAGLRGSRTSLGILPLGTANVIAREIGLPMDPVAAADAILVGREREIHPGIVSGPSNQERQFLQMVGIAFDAEVVHGVRLAWKKRFGRLAYILQGLAIWPRYEVRELGIRLDDEPPESAAGVLVMNGGLYGGPYRVAPGETPHEPGFTVLIQRRADRWANLAAALALPLHRLASLPFVELRRCHRIEVRGHHLVQCDGDAAGSLPLVISVDATPLRVRVP